MTDVAPASPGGPPTASPARFAATFAAVLSAIVLLFILDTVLARLDRTESETTAASHYVNGSALLARGDPRRASDEFAAAVALDRGNVNYALGLGEAMLRDGRVPEAEATLKALLGRAETDGAVNLAMAHVLEREGRLDEAKSYFHRAIYGRWGADSAQERQRARFDLIDLLVRQREMPELLAELLPLQEAPPDDLELRRKLAHLFLITGSPARGAAIFRDLVRHDGQDADAYAGLGQAALAVGNFRAASADLATASRLRPNDLSIADRRMVADSAVALNPMEPRLDGNERYRRAQRIAVLTRTVVERCATPSIAVPAQAPSGSRIVANDNARAQTLLDSVDARWRARPSGCVVGPSVAEQALGFVLARISP